MENYEDDDIEKLQIVLTPTQMRSWKKQKAFRISYEQLAHGHDKERHLVHIHVSPATRKKIDAAIRRHKGFTMTPQIILGGSFFGDIGSTFSNIGN